MKPLVYWCRWHEATLRLRGRDPQAIWGELVYKTHTEPFHFDLHTAILTRYETEQREHKAQLDEMGVATPLPKP